MVRTLTAFTSEIDEVDLAVGELLEQLDLENKLCKNSLGILTCYSEFVETGVVEALGQRLPFPLVGCTTMAKATEEAMGGLMLGLAVLTSDDVCFSTARAPALPDRHRESLEAAYHQARRQLPADPVMMLTFGPMLGALGGDAMVSELDEITDGLPNFGTISVDHTPDLHTCHTFYNGEAYRDSLSLVLLSGDIRPSFFLASISDGKIQRQKAIITAASDNLLLEVNDMPILKYLQTLGFDQDHAVLANLGIPFIIDYNDGTRPLARNILAITPEGHAVCGGNMPLHSTLAIASLDYEDVVTTAREIAGQILQAGKQQGLLTASCLGRYLVLGTAVSAEMEVLREHLRDTVPYQMFYSGGEICPVPDETGRLVNRFHNDTIAACLF